MVDPYNIAPLDWPVQSTQEFEHQSMTAGRGGRLVITSLVCPALSLALALVVLGRLGVAAGFVATWKGFTLLRP